MPELTELSNFTLLRVFSFLNTRDALAMTSTNRNQRALQDSALFWRQRVKVDFKTTVPQDIDAKEYYHELSLQQDAGMLAAFIKTIRLCFLEEFRVFAYYALIFQKPADFLQVFNEAFQSTLQEGDVYRRLAQDFPLVLDEHIGAAIKEVANEHQSIEDFVAKFVRLPIEARLAVSEESIFFVNSLEMRMPDKLPLNVLESFASSRMWYSVRHHLLSLTSTELSEAMNRCGPSLFKYCVRYGEVGQARWLFDHGLSPASARMLLKVLIDLKKFSHHMEAMITESIKVDASMIEAGDSITQEQKAALFDMLNGDVEAMEVILSGSISKLKTVAWRPKNQTLERYYSQRISAYQAFFDLLLQHGADPDEICTLYEVEISAREKASELIAQFAADQTIPAIRKAQLTHLLHSVIRAPVKNVQELGAEVDDEAGQCGRLMCRIL